MERGWVANRWVVKVSGVSTCRICFQLSQCKEVVDSFKNIPAQTVAIKWETISNLLEPTWWSQYHQMRVWSRLWILSQHCWQYPAAGGRRGAGPGPGRPLQGEGRLNSRLKTAKTGWEEERWIAGTLEGQTDWQTDRLTDWNNSIAATKGFYFGWFG